MKNSNHISQFYDIKIVLKNSLNDEFYQKIYKKNNKDEIVNKKPKQYIKHKKEKRLKYFRLKPFINKGMLFNRVLHWGQRKLLFSEIEFMMIAIKEFPKVKKFSFLYIGAAAGTHLYSLAYMFKDHLKEFILFDSNPFDMKYIKKIRDLGIKVDIQQRYFLEKDIQDYKKYQNLLFCSDIRSNTDDKAIIFDMDLQMNIAKKIKPLKTILKFRLTWEKGIRDYLDGIILLQIWPPLRSTETRLICGPNYKMKKYDRRIYEEELNYYNLITRCRPNTYLNHNFQKKGYCICNDCNREIKVLQDYIKKYLKNKPTDKKVEFYIDLIDTNLGSNIYQKTMKKNKNIYIKNIKYIF